MCLACMQFQKDKKSIDLETNLYRLYLKNEISRTHLVDALLTLANQPEEDTDPPEAA